MPARLADCKDRFLVEALAVGPDCKEVGHVLFDSNRGAIK